MKVLNEVEEQVLPAEGEPGADLLRGLVLRPSLSAEVSSGSAGAVIGELVALQQPGNVPLVTSPRLDGKAVAARSVVDLHGAHVGRQVVLMFEGGDPARPLVMGVLRPIDGWPLNERPEQVDVDADGRQLVVTAQSQIVLRCGKASITLTSAGKVLIQGTYVSHRSSGVMRVKGGSVQIN